ncbi:nickel pincer cofactor biosynthesis protein LarB [Desulforhopalus singaporensis]|uniref:PurE domain-containing protein n=1 Tax=Desulforhopalus singaporensis TaxID=91360 RepID=A0A1H0JSD6_9BACT|nr:nickel pincer cofactor biosynthesis protein LarB [Desulforhopalus singaporensis]SDO46658.1 hypothetical protein SAMN05660330_00305 [Desulforhopalus singaporensis]
MDPRTLTDLLNRVKDATCTVEEAMQQLTGFPSEIMEHANLDHQRHLRTGIPEVIYGASKTVEQIITIARAMLKRASPVLVTRVDPQKAAKILCSCPELEYHEPAGLLCANKADVRMQKTRGKALVVCAGTSDIRVAEEARLTLELFGHPVGSLYDIGVAGLHRLFYRQQLLHEASVIIVVAGMEGALPSVVAGLARAPVIAVPTSVGYGASLGGIAALLGMLNSCAPGVAVVNIDNGFGAACMAHAINCDYSDDAPQ